MGRLVELVFLVSGDAWCELHSRAGEQRDVYGRFTALLVNHR